jgi:hypothetical protein
VSFGVRASLDRELSSQVKDMKFVHLFQAELLRGGFLGRVNQDGTIREANWFGAQIFLGMILVTWVLWEWEHRKKIDLKEKILLGLVAANFLFCILPKPLGWPGHLSSQLQLNRMETFSELIPKITCQKPLYLPKKPSKNWEVWVGATSTPKIIIWDNGRWEYPPLPPRYWATSATDVDIMITRREETRQMEGWETWTVDPLTGQKLSRINANPTYTSKLTLVHNLKCAEVVFSIESSIGSDPFDIQILNELIDYGYLRISKNELRK